MLSLFYILLIALIAAALGRKVFGAAGVRFWGFLEEFCFSAGLGLMLLSLASFALGLSGLLYKWVFRLLLAAALAILFKEIIRISLRFKNQLRGFPTFRKDRLQLVLLLIIGLSYLLSLVGALTPPSEYDETTYHLTIPKIYIQHHRICPIPEIVFAAFPKNIEMLFMLGMLIHSDILSKLFLFLLSLLTAAAIYSFGRRFFSREIGLYAATVFSTTPYVINYSSYAGVDLGLTFYIVLTFYAFMNWFKSNDKKMLLAAFLFAGFCPGIKYTGIILPPVLLIGMVYKLALLDRARPGRILKQLAPGIIIVALIGVPWYLKTYIDTNSFVTGFTSITFRYLRQLNPLGSSLGQALKNFSVGVWRFNVSASWWKSPGPLYLFLVPLLLVLRRPERTIKITLWYGAVSLVLFYLIMPGLKNRYFFPYLSVLSICCAYSYQRLTSGDKLLKKIVTAVVLLTVCFTLFLFLGKSSFKLPVVLGLKSKDAYLRPLIDSYGVTVYTNKNLDDSSKIFLMGEQSYYFEKPVVIGQKYSTHLNYMACNSVKELLKLLKDLGITHIVLDRTHFMHKMHRKRQDKIWELVEQWEGKYFQPIYSENNTTLYQVNYH